MPDRGTVSAASGRWAADFNAAENKLLQLVVAQHEGELGWVWRQMLRIPLRRKVKALIGELIESGSADGGMLDRPGLWRYVKWEAGARQDFPSRLAALACGRRRITRSSRSSTGR
jgi:hypothetical protein